jgi:serine phosphatase RsbU (regulator of sigma subunit)
MSTVPLSLFLIIAATLLALAVAIVIAYLKFPLHLIYKSKVGYESMLDAVNDPLAVVGSDYIVRRANRAYVSLVSGSFQSSIGRKCYELLRDRREPCADCRMPHAITLKKQQVVERSPHPSGKGALRLSFSPYAPETETPGSHFVIEHIRDITVLEQLKADLEEKNTSLATAMRKLKQAQRNIIEDLHLARQIQEGILPKSAPDVPGIAMAIKYHPVADVGGDLYDFIPFENSKLSVFVGDASGHGLAAALIGTISKMSLYNHSRKELPPHRMIAEINRDLISNIQTYHYLTCFLGMFDFKRQTFNFSRAGHPVPVVIRRDGSVYHLNCAGTFAGVLKDAVYEESVFNYRSGDRFFIFTDGIYEIQKDDGPHYGYDRFVKLLADLRRLPVNRVIPAIEEHFAGYTFNDDYTMIIIEIKEGRRSDEDTVLISVRR